MTWVQFVPLVLLAIIGVAIAVADAREKVNGVLLKATRNGDVITWTDREGDDR